MSTAVSTAYYEIDGRPLLGALRKVGQGDFSCRLPLDQIGMTGEVCEAFNFFMDLLERSTNEVERVSRVVGTEGKISQRAALPGAAGGWAVRMESVNDLIDKLIRPTVEVSRVIGAVARGDLSEQMALEIDGFPLEGEFLRLGNAVNAMVDELHSFASELTRVAHEVGAEGKLGGQADISRVGGTWNELGEHFNLMVQNVTSQVRETSEVTAAVARGDLSKRYVGEARGEFLEMKNVLNAKEDMLNAVASELTRVAREVGAEGKLGGQADLKGAAGIWKELGEHINLMVQNVTSQVRETREVTAAVARGDLTKRYLGEACGEFLEMKNVLNAKVDLLNAVTAELTRVAREVGTDGKLGGQADVKGTSGAWKELADHINLMVHNVTSQVRETREVTAAVARGDLTKRYVGEARGEFLDMKSVLNAKVDMLNNVASELTRLAREVGTEGKLGGQAVVKDVAGVWKELTDSVNTVAGNLTVQLRDVSKVATAIARGDLGQKITVDVRGEILQIKDTINATVDQLNSFASEVTRVAREVGAEGMLGGQASVPGVGGTWKDLTDNVNAMAGNLTVQLRDVSKVASAIAKGDLGQKITVDVRGEILQIKDTINATVDQLNSFASEVTRVAREMGAEGKLGGQALVPGVAGTWKDLTDNVNAMAGNLTVQLRDVSKVATAIARGDLGQKITVDVRGEILQIKDTINSMIDTLATFAEQVTGVAREVGVEGKLGGQADVPGAAGTWKNLTENVNELAANLSGQVRAIAEVATSVTKGDLTRSITVEARGEVAELKDNVNQMIANLRDTTKQNTEQDWLKTNLAKFTRMLQGQREMVAVAKLILDELAPLVSAQHGVFYIMEKEGDQQELKLQASYAYQQRRGLSNRFRMGEGLVGQCALEKERIVISDVPRNYVRISSGLGNGRPRNVAVIPILFEGGVKAVVELASFNPYTAIHLAFLDQLAEGIGIVLNSISAGMRTEQLLKQSQSLAQELQSQQAELQEKNVRLEKQTATLKQSEELLTQQQEKLQQTNAELGDKARLLALQKNEVEAKNQQIELARTSLQDKAEQLALSSKYKSEFLANMSHELRTPLNSLLLLSKLMADNSEGNLNAKQLEYVRTIQGSGVDLLTLINGILDMAKIESGKVVMEPAEILLEDVRAETERNFSAQAQQQGLAFEVRLDPRLPRHVYTDNERLHQVLKNLLSNAFKFTHQGRVDVAIEPVASGWSIDHPVLSKAERVIAFRVSDTGIGIDKELLKVIFEPFHQGDGGTARKYGGTGLGLSISRELARLLGGELGVQSELGKGSTFTLYLPQIFVSAAQAPPRTVSLFGPAPITAAAPLGAPLGFGVPQGLVATQGLGATQSQVSGARERRLQAVADDRASLQAGERAVLIIEDDPAYAEKLLALVRERGLKGLVALTGQAGIVLAAQHSPAAITLDLLLPDVNGWLVLDQLKRNPATAHIPVQVVTVVENDRHRALRAGALGFLTKTASDEALRDTIRRLDEYAARRTKQLLVLENSEPERRTIVDTIGDGAVKTTAVGSCGEALEALRSGNYDCMVVDPIFPDRSGFKLLGDIQQDAKMAKIPLIVYTPQPLSPQDQAELGLLTDPLVVRNADSMDVVLADTTVFLHRAESELPEGQRKLLHRAEPDNGKLVGKKVLIVDDDPRNALAMTAVLEQQRLEVLYAECGMRGLEILENTAGIDAVLMDIMMPEMDGYETTRRLRALPQYKELPVIAVTAKAMKGDREKCLDAGCSDYIAKPVDSDHLLAVLRTWIGR